MLRKNLLLTTAFVVAASLPSLATPATPQIQPAAATLRHDNNGEFLKAYAGVGRSCSSDSGFQVEGHQSKIGSSSSSVWKHVAVPFTGRGKTVRRILVKDYPQYAPSFTASIHSNAPSGLPGKMIVAGTASRSNGCGKVSIPISPTKLARKTKYWLEETMPLDPSSAFVVWTTAPHATQKAYAQFHRRVHTASSSSSYTTPWTVQTGGPWFRLK
jgi:hypothetical protein